MAIGDARACLRASSVALTLVGATCSDNPPTFYNPKTGVIAPCLPTDLDPMADECIATYQRAGWQKVTGPIINRETPPKASSP
jgi:hypothetical protein